MSAAPVGEGAPPPSRPRPQLNGGGGGHRMAARAGEGLNPQPGGEQHPGTEHQDEGALGPGWTAPAAAIRDLAWTSGGTWGVERCQFSQFCPLEAVLTTPGCVLRKQSPESGAELRYLNRKKGVDWELDGLGSWGQAGVAFLFRRSARNFEGGSDY